MDRTLACEAENPGSTPGGVTRELARPVLFCYYNVVHYEF